MIAFDEIARRYGDRPFLIESGIPLTYGDFIKRVEQAVRDTAGSSPENPLTALELTWSVDSLIRLFALWRLDRNVILDKDIPEGSLGPFLGDAPLLVLRTGGTTGNPRHVVHSLKRLLARYRPQNRAPSRLLPLYAADHIAGLDALLQAFHRGTTLVFPDSRSARAIVECLERDKVEILPATPTYLQFLLLSGELDGADVSSVRVIPHGAEAMPQALRRRLKNAFPNARLYQRFGLTELGAVPVEEDPMDPSVLLMKPVPGFSWRIEDGELWIQSPSRMLGTIEDGPVSPDDTWHHTGDLVEMAPSGGLRILGRREFMINVGGLKVIPEKVEALLLSQEGVRDASVYGIPNPLTGEAVCAEVVYAGEPDHMALLSELRRAAQRKGLPLAYVPTRIVAVERIGKTAFGKRPRLRGKT